MFKAVLVTNENLDIITALNDGVQPAQECIDNPTYFVWPFDHDGHSALVGEEMYNIAFKTVKELDMQIRIVTTL